MGKETEDKFNKKEKSKKKSSKAKSSLNFDDDSGNESEDEVDWVLDQLEDSEDKDESPMVKKQKDDESVLQELGKSLSPSQTEQSILQKWYGIIYDGKKKKSSLRWEQNGFFLMMMKLMVLYMELNLIV